MGQKNVIFVSFVWFLILKFEGKNIKKNQFGGSFTYIPRRKNYKCQIMQIHSIVLRIHSLFLQV